MTMYFSASTCGFYDSTINLTRPSDAVEISDADYKALIEGQSEGKIEADANGYPILVMPTAIDLEKSALLTVISDLTQQIIDSDLATVPIMRDLVLAPGDTALIASLTALKDDYDILATALATAKADLAALG